MSDGYDDGVTFTADEWREMDAHADELGRRIEALEPMAEAAVDYRQVLYGLAQRGALDPVGLADLERVDDKHGKALDTYINGEGDDTDD